MVIMATAQTEHLAIDPFWKGQLAPVVIQSLAGLPGWNEVREPAPMFKEAPLHLSDEFPSSFGPQGSSLLLVSAPGAVGKTTLAKQIAYCTGAIYVDLAQSDPVGGHTLSGGLVRTNTYQSWMAGTTTVLLDGLDEARLRVTQEAFEAFLRDVLSLSAGRALPTVIFGRSGSIQEAWYTLAQGGLESPVLEIGYYDERDAVEFCHAKLQSEDPNRLHPEIDRRAITLLLERIRSQTEGDGDRFAGYAPVLQAVSERVGKESNTAALISRIEKGTQPVTLQDIATSILTRERTKLQSLIFDDAHLSDVLYSSEEQLMRLSSKVYGEAPLELPPMSDRDARTYENALRTWVDDHPFLDGNGEPSSSVFSAVIATITLRRSVSRKAKERALQRELAKGLAANPFLSEIYLNELAEKEDKHIPPEHVGVIYSSLRARLSLGDTANLAIEMDDGPEGENIRNADVEITQSRKQEASQRVIALETDFEGFIRLGAHIEDIEIEAPKCCVEIGSSNEVVLAAPVSVQCDLLSIEASHLVVDTPQDKSLGAVFLMANDFSGGKVMSISVLRDDTKLRVCWPNAASFPWANYEVGPVKQDDVLIDEALRRLRKFVISFRSHGKGKLARYKGKIEHRRMTKGSGRNVLAQMISDGLVSLKDSMYYLNSDKLSEHTGLSYADCMEFRFGQRAVDFVRRAIGRGV